PLWEPRGDISGAARRDRRPTPVRLRPACEGTEFMTTHADPAGTAVTVVDDEPAALDVLVRAARSWQFECQAATTAEPALLLLEQRLTPVVVTDLRMPGRGGVWLVREIQRRWPEVSIIVITAGQDPDAVSECLSAGAHHYFLKPIKLDEFRHALEVTARGY